MSLEIGFSQRDVQTGVKALHDRRKVMAAVLRTRGRNADRVQLDGLHKLAHGVKCGNAVPIRRRGRPFLVQIADGNKVRALAGLVDACVRVANVAHTDRRYVKHGSSSSGWSGRLRLAAIVSDGGTGPARGTASRRSLPPAG